MKAIGIILAAILMLSTNPLSAQPNGKGYDRLFDPNTVVKMQGVITDIQLINTGGRNSGVHIKLKSGENIINVHLGPSWYINKQDMKLKVNDEVTVTGSKVDMNGDKVILASEVQKGKKVLQLRHKDGTPLWSGKGRL